MAVLYSIRDWKRHFEVAQSRKLTKAMTWVPTPCKHDGKSFRRIMLLPDGVTVYGAWMLIVQIAAKCPVRGVLADADGPLDASDLAVKTGAPEAIFERALSICSSNKIGWIVGVAWENSGRAVPLKDNTGQDNTGQDKELLRLESRETEEGIETAAPTDGEPPADPTAASPTEAPTDSKKPTARSYLQAFQDFWEAYPYNRDGRKRGKGECYDLWRQAIRKSDRQSLVDAAKAYAACEQVGDGFVRDPIRFLKKDWWRDWLLSPGERPKPDRVVTAADMADYDPAGDGT